MKNKTSYIWTNFLLGVLFIFASLVNGLLNLDSLGLTFFGFAVLFAFNAWEAELQK